MGEDQRFELNCLTDVGFESINIFPVKSTFIGPQPPFYAAQSKEKTTVITGFSLLTAVAEEGLEQPQCRRLEITPPCRSQRKEMEAV